MKVTRTEIKKRIVLKENKTEGILNYDIDNAYPQRADDIVNASGAASLCVEMKMRFLVGGGMLDKVFYKTIVNGKGLTVDKLLRKNAEDKTRKRGIALHINYNALFDISEVNYLAFNHCRFTTPENEEHPNMIAVYDNWDRSKGKNIIKEKIDYINFYNPDPAVIQEQVDQAGGWENYKGQVLYWTPNGHEYPLVPYDSVLEDIQTDAQSKLFKFRNVTTNFMASHIMVTPPMEGDEEKSGTNERDEFKQNLEEYQGADQASKILWVEADDVEKALKLIKVDIQDVDKLYEYTEGSCRDNIIRNFLIPPVLLMSISGKLGSSSEIEDATAYYNGITADDRLVIEEIYREVFTRFHDKSINPSGDYSIIPYKSPASNNKIAQEYFPYCTKNEIRDSIGQPEIKDAEADEKPMYEALGVGGLTAMNEMLANPALTREQKDGQLEVIYKVSEEDRLKLLGAPQKI